MWLFSLRSTGGVSRYNVRGAKAKPDEDPALAPDIFDVVPDRPGEMIRPACAGPVLLQPIGTHEFICVYAV